MGGTRRKARLAPLGLGAVAVLAVVAALFWGSGAAQPDNQDQNAIAAEPPVVTLPSERTHSSGALARLHTRSLAVPQIEILRDRDGTSGGLVFANPRPPSTRTKTGPMIFDEQGRIAWFHMVGSGLTTVNLRPQTYRGRTVLTWGKRPTNMGDGNAHNTYVVIADDHYNIVKRLRAVGDGVRTDLHEFVITPRNTALLLGQRNLVRDLSAVGGSSSGVITEGLVQEIDIATGRVLLNWHSLQHVDPSESHERPKAGRPFDYLHLNSIAEDSDGNLLLSARHTSTVYKIDRDSGRMIWRLGGKKSSFRMTRGTRFRYQHDARRLPSGQIQLFDNGIERAGKAKGRTRALRLTVDTRRHRATVAEEYPQPSRKVAISQGNAQLLPNGNVFVGWGSVERLSEFSADGTWLWGAKFPGSDWQSYRAFKGQWHARPEGRPLVAAGRGGHGSTLVWVSWNGATEIARWRVMTGPRPAALEERGQADWAGLETKVRVPGQQRYVRVDALDARGRELGRSEVVRVG